MQQLHKSMIRELTHGEHDARIGAFFVARGEPARLDAPARRGGGRRRGAVVVETACRRNPSCLPFRRAPAPRCPPPRRDARPPRPSRW